MMYSMMPSRTEPPGRGHAMRFAALLLSLLLVAPAHVAARGPAAPPLGVPGLAEAHLDPAFWIGTLPDPDRVILTPAQIAAQNAHMRAGDPSIHDLAALPATIDGARVRAWIEGLSVLPGRPLYDVHGEPVAAGDLERVQANLALDAVPARQDARFGMVVRRADLRAFPTRLRVFTTRGDGYIDRFQESALFPGDPVVVLHASRDGDWLFVLSERYAAWIEAAHVAEGGRDEVLAWGRREPFLVVTGATAHTVYTPENPRVSQVQLEMGVRVPVLPGPPTGAVNGQYPSAHHVIELPVRGDDGRLAFEPALLPRSADVADDYLPLTEANIVRQAFKFLGERYGWGHSYNARDCSGFASEVYRSFGVLIPRNTSAQAVSTVLNRLGFDAGDPRERRVQALREARPGDLVYFP